MKSKLKKSLGALVALIAIMALLNSNTTNAESFGCEANDPGECSAECPDGSPCCVGFSPNCTQDSSTIVKWIDCGDGQLYCSGGNED